MLETTNILCYLIVTDFVKLSLKKAVILKRKSFIISSKAFKIKFVSFLEYKIKK